MYDPAVVLAAIDRNAVPILALCALAMAMNYMYFIEAIIKGFRDRAYPFPVFCTMFWLTGDGSMVLDYHTAFVVVNHWYMKAFWFALVITTGFELLYLYMIMRFGRREIAPGLTQPQFVASLVAGQLIMFMAYHFIKARMGDVLVIDYFNLANLSGPVFGWALLNRRGTLAGTSPRIWLCFTVLIASWSTALALYFGPPFASPGYLLFYAVAVSACIAVTIRAMQLPPAPPEPESA